MKKVKITEVKINPNNPRLIKDEKFKKLVQSIKDFPEMLDIRPIVTNKEMVILGGNMRYKACVEAGLKEIPVIITDFTEKKQREFLIKDNVSGGEWDWDILANEWNEVELEDWGLTINNFTATDVNLDDFFTENNEQKEQKNKIVLEYTDEDFELVNEAFKKHSGSKEQIIFKLLGL